MSADTSLDRYGLDSIMATRLRIEIERRHGVQIPAAALRELASIEDLVERVSSEASKVRAGLDRCRFDDNSWPHFRLGVSLLSGGAAKAHLFLDGSVVDGVSTALLLEQWGYCYDDPHAELPLSELSARQAIVALLELESTSQYRRALEGWLARLADLPAGPILQTEPSTARPGGDMRLPRMSRRSTLSADVWRRVRQAAARLEALAISGGGSRAVPLGELEQAYFVHRVGGLSRPGGGCQAYQSFAVEQRSLGRLVESWQRMVDAYDVLRSVVDESGRRWVKEPGTSVVTLPVIDLSDLDSGA